MGARTLASGTAVYRVSCQTVLVLPVATFIT